MSAPESRAAEALPAPKRPIRVRALGVAERLDPRLLQQQETIAIAPIVMRAGEAGAAVLFRYGAAVLFDVSPEEEEEVLSKLGPGLVSPFHELEVEEVRLTVDAAREEGLDEQGELWLRAWDAPRMQVVAEVLAKSVALAHYEREAARTFDRLEPLVERLSRGRRPGDSQQRLLGQLGETLLAQARTLGRAEIAERPEIIWDRPALGRLYQRLAVEYELMERDHALTRKNDFISSSVGALIDLVQQRQSIRLEWYIVVLIMIEIVILLYELFWRT